MKVKIRSGSAPRGWKFTVWNSETVAAACESSGFSRRNAGWWTAIAGFWSETNKCVAGKLQRKLRLGVSLKKLEKVSDALSSPERPWSALSSRC